MRNLFFAALAASIFIFSINDIADAAIANGSFEEIDSILSNPYSTSKNIADFSVWEEIGNVYTSLMHPTLTFDFTNGTQAAVLSTSDYSNNFTMSHIESFLNIHSGTISQAVAGTPFYGSAIKQAFTAQAGHTLTFDWNFITSEGQNAVRNDSAFVAIDGKIIILADTRSKLSLRSDLPLLETGYSTLEIEINSSGNHSIAFGVIDVNGLPGDSFLVVDSVLIKDNAVNTTPIAELGDFYLYHLSGIKDLVGEYDQDDLPEEIRTEVLKHLLLTIYGFANGDFPVLDFANLAIEVMYNIGDEDAPTLFQQECKYQDHDDGHFSLFPLVLMHLKSGYERYFKRSEINGILYDPPVFRMTFSYENIDISEKNKKIFELVSTVEDQILAYDQLVEGEIYALVPKPSTFDYDEYLQVIRGIEGNSDGNASIDIIAPLKFTAQFNLHFGNSIGADFQEWLNDNLVIKGNKCKFDSISSVSTNPVIVKESKMTQVSGHLENEYDIDVFKIDAKAGESIDVTVTGKSLYTLEMLLVSEEENSVTLHAQNDSDTDRLSYNVEENGKYFLFLYEGEESFWDCRGFKFDHCHSPWEYKLKINVDVPKGKKAQK